MVYVQLFEKITQLHTPNLSHHTSNQSINPRTKVERWK